MAKEKSPAFQFYAKEFLTDGNVYGMSLQERGAYITLICICWQEGSLPVDLERLAHMVSTPRTAFAKLWPAVRACFTEQDGRFIHPRLDKEREKQAVFRQLQSDRGKGGATVRWRKHRPTMAQAKPDDGPSIAGAQPDDSSPISDLRSPVPVLKKEQVGTARSKRPIFTGQRLTVFEWMFDDLCRMLGVHTDDFRLDEWFYAADAKAMREEVVMSDWWPWLKAETQAEAERRGLPIAVVTAAPTAGKLTTRMAQMVANSRSGS